MLNNNDVIESISKRCLINTSILKFCNWNWYQKGRHSVGPSNRYTLHLFSITLEIRNESSARTHHPLQLYHFFFFFFATIESHFARSNVRSHHHWYSASIQGSSKRRPPRECQPIRKSRQFSSTWRPTSRSRTSSQPFLPRGWSARDHRSITFRFFLPLFRSVINVLAPGKNHAARENATSTAALFSTLVC